MSIPTTFQKTGDHFDPYASESDTREMLELGKMPEPLRLAAMLEKTMQSPLHGRAADELRKLHELLQRCESEMRYAGWTVRDADNYMKNDLYEEIKKQLEPK